jgi:hypothetical protein
MISGTPSYDDKGTFLTGLKKHNKIDNNNLMNETEINLEPNEEIDSQTNENDNEKSSKNFITYNKNKLKNQMKLTDQEELRLQQILSENDEDNYDSFQLPKDYGLNADDKMKLRSIDIQLMQYNENILYEEYYDDDDENHPHELKQKKNILLQQRLDRMKQQLEHDIDKKLKVYQSTFVSENLLT